MSCSFKSNGVNDLTYISFYKDLVSVGWNSNNVVDNDNEGARMVGTKMVMVEAKKVERGGGNVGDYGGMVVMEATTKTMAVARARAMAVAEALAVVR